MTQQLQEWIQRDQFKELMEGSLNAPQDILGMHETEYGQVFTAFRPHANHMWLVAGKNQEIPMECLDERGFFAVINTNKPIKKYQLRIEYGPEDIIQIDDPYAFATEISDFDLHLFAEGNHYRMYEKLGAHPQTCDGVRGTRFAVWAPNARAVSVVGDFNMWDGSFHPMIMHKSSGVYELFVPGVYVGTIYKFQIKTREGQYLLKTDPYANQGELRPNNASVVCDINDYKWKDSSYEKKHRQQTDHDRTPMTIYEVHLGSWKKRIEDDDNGSYTYRELTGQLSEYVKDMGYTHVELMGISEYPFDGSWGYQVTGYFAPTSRYGTVQDFKYFVDVMHQQGIQVILDWVPAHFPKDAHALGRFDGMPEYEHPDSRRGEHPDWGTYIFNYGKKEVSNFLISSGLFWLREFHIDGLRVDAVASMLYLDYGKKDGEWLPNKDGGNEHYEAVEFLRHLNQVVQDEMPEKYIIAEESTAWAGVTQSPKKDGLGFTYKWNMGWMNDFLEYMKLDPYFKQFNHNRLTFSMQYAYSEKFVLVLSHDEVVHGKGSMIGKMPGVGADKYASLRAAYGFMYGHPGKKLLFMGQEFAQNREWSEARSLDWWQLDQNELSSGIKEFVKDLNHLYVDYDALYYNDYDTIGFQWMNCDRQYTSTVAFVRRGSTCKNQLLFICNFTPVGYDDYKTGVPCNTTFYEVINSDDTKYGGQGKLNKQVIHAKKDLCDGFEYSITCKLPPLSIVIMKYDYVES